jgi:hypothetical protein
MRHPHAALVAVMLTGLISLACNALSPTTYSPGFVTMTPGGQALAASPTPRSTATATNVATSTAVAAITQSVPLTAQPTVSYLGDVVEQAGYALAALQLQDPALPGSLYQAQAGRRLVAVEVMLGNVAGERMLANGSSLLMRDEAGGNYQPDVLALDRSLGASRLDAGERVKGWVAFHLPDGARPVSVHYVFGLSPGIELAAGLDLAPPGHAPLIGSNRIAPGNARLGEASEVGGYSLVALNVEDPAPATVLFQAQPGLRLVAVEIEVSNVSGDRLSVNILNSSLVDVDGFVYAPRLGAHTGELLATDISTGQRVRGWVAFAIPEGSTMESVKYQLSVVSDVVLRAGLLP